MCFLLSKWAVYFFALKFFVWWNMGVVYLCVIERSSMVFSFEKGILKIKIDSLIIMYLLLM